MRRIAAVISLFFAAVLMLTLPHAAEAKRLGYGGNMGKQYTAPKSSTTSPTTAQRQDAPTQTAATAPRPSGASRWLGPLAGLAAGGLIGAMLFGDGFEGFKLFDFLLIAALIFGAMMLFRAIRSRTVLQPAGGPAFGGAYTGRDTAPAATPLPGTGGSDAPAWFNRENFLKGARVHFIRMQAAWDKGDMKDIATYTTPELFAELQAERLARGDKTHYTEVGYLDAELLGVQRDGGNVVATLRFFGGIKEEQEGEQQEFAELWHVVHAWDRPEGDWYVAGIQQV
jgi:predicted lipid-binding transport protein (Tim44 family)